MDLPTLVFVLVYAGMMLGGLPGLRLDRTGVALLGAIVLLAAGNTTSQDAWRAIDVGTIGLLLGLMVVSAQFRLGGAYTRLTRWLAERPTSPTRLLLELVLVVGGLSALLTNDVICLAIAPVLVDVAARRQLDPVPYLLALAAAANVGSAATLIGNPQNILIGQALDLAFVDYLRLAAVPTALGLGVVFLVIAHAYRGRFVRDFVGSPVQDQTFDRWQTFKGTLVLSLLVVALVAGLLPAEILALLAGGLLLLSRRLHTREMLALVDWQLLVLFAGLFVVNHTLAEHGHILRAFTWLTQRGLAVDDPAVLFATSVLGSNVVSNVPWTMLVLPAATHPLAGPILALSTTLAGNLLLVGSIANLIVVEQASRLGVRPLARSWVHEHLRTGVPITFGTLAIAAAWLWLWNR